METRGARDIRPRLASSRTLAGALIVCACVLTEATASTHSTPAVAGATNHELVVAPDGNDENPGTAPKPLQTLQRALDLAQPGTTITLSPGVYGAAQSRRPGLPGLPILIRGPETGRDPARRFQAVVRGPRVVLQINHSHYRLQGFTIDGQPGIDRRQFPSALDAARPFKDEVQAIVANSKLVYVGYAPDSRDITGIVIDDMFLHGAGGECVRFRNNAYGNVVSNSVIEWCGLAPSGDDRSRYRYHNGEGVYIGTSPKSVEQPMASDDTTREIVVRDSLIATFGSECFQVKENAHHNTMLRVDCRSNDEPLAFGGSNVELRGDHNTVADSLLSGSRGVNLKIAFDAPGFDRGGNQMLGNRFSDAAGPHLRLQTSQSPGLGCGNAFATENIGLTREAAAGLSAACPRQ